MLNNNLKSTLTKTAAAAALTLAGAAIVNNTQNTVKAAEVTVGQQEKIVTINYLPHKSIAVWNSYGPDKQMTGQYLPHATAWKVIRAAYDDAGNKWYDLGANQWVMAKYTRLGKDTVDPNVASELFTSQASSYNTAAQTQTTQGSYSAPKTSVGSYSSVQSTQTQQAPVQKHNLHNHNQATLQTYLVLKQQLRHGLQDVNQVVHTQQEMVNTSVNTNYQHHTLVETIQQQTKNV